MTLVLAAPLPARTQQPPVGTLDCKRLYVVGTLGDSERFAQLARAWTTLELESVSHPSILPHPPQPRVKESTHEARGDLAGRDVRGSWVAEQTGLHACRRRHAGPRYRRQRSPLWRRRSTALPRAVLHDRARSRAPRVSRAHV